MGIPDRIILTLYTFLMAVVAVLVVLCSLGVIGQTAITAFFATIPGNWEYAVGGIIILLVSIRLLIAGIGATGMTSLTISSADSGKVSVGKQTISYTHKGKVTEDQHNLDITVTVIPMIVEPKIVFKGKKK